jgi:hypothetical protein
MPAKSALQKAVEERVKENENHLGNLRHELEEKKRSVSEIEVAIEMYAGFIADDKALLATPKRARGTKEEG